MPRRPLLSGSATGAITCGLTAAALLAAPAVSAQTISLDVKNGTLGELVGQFSRQSGYEFHLGPIPDVDTIRHDFSCKEVPVSGALDQLASLFKCDFFSIDAGGFYAVPATKPPLETPVGPYRLRTSGPYLQTEAENALTLTLMFSGANEEKAEEIAGLGPDLRVVDNFGRSLLPLPSAGLLTTSAPRLRLTEYWQRLQLSLRDANAVRIRSVKGTLVLYRKVTPLKFEFPLDGSTLPRTIQQSGLDFRLNSIAPAGNEYVVQTRLAWPENWKVVGRGILRPPLPYLVDDTGQVYRDNNPVQPRTKENGESVWDERLHFEGVHGKPTRLVYEVFLKEQPDVKLPFELKGIPLPPRETAGFSAASQPYYTMDGGTLVFPVRDKDGRPIEGEVTVGLSRKTPAGWSAIRWTQLITEPDGTVRLDHLQPGTYRLSRSFRSVPSAPPLPSADRPVEVTIAAKKESIAAPLQLTVALPAP